MREQAQSVGAEADHSYQTSIKCVSEADIFSEVESYITTALLFLSDMFSFEIFIHRRDTGTL